MFVISLESSHTRGMGHLYRSLTIATEIQSRGHKILLLANNDRVARTVLKKSGFNFRTVDYTETTGQWENQVISEYQPIAWINDRMNTSCCHVNILRKSSLISFTFDDLGPCAQFYETNFCPLALSAPVRPNCLIGPRYLPLNPLALSLRKTRSNVGRIIVSLGGADTYGITPQLLSQLRACTLPVTVVLGPSYLEPEKTISQFGDTQFQFKTSVPCLLSEMSEHDVAITSGGVTPFEAAAIGLPTLVLATEPHERVIGEYLEATGSSIYLGFRHSFSLISKLDQLKTAKMSSCALATVDGLGTQRVVDLIEANLF